MTKALLILAAVIAGVVAGALAAPARADLPPVPPERPGIASWHVSGKLRGQMNVRASALASGIVRAVRDAEVIQEGGDPERLSEKAMRLAAEARR
jgi:energy-converting hydrogenase Eha subunit A